MQNITIGRYDKDPDAQGVIKPGDGRWQLVLDADGYPHLYIQVQIENDDGKGTHPGMLALDDIIPPEMSIRDLMDGGAFGGSLSPEEEAAAIAEYEASRKANPVPCPR